MGLDLQLRSILDQMIDDMISDSRSIILTAKVFKPLIASEIDLAFGIMIGDVVSSFSIIFASIKKRSIEEEELNEVYHIIMSRAEEIYDVFRSHT